CWSTNRSSRPPRSSGAERPRSTGAAKPASHAVWSSWSARQETRELLSRQLISARTQPELPTLRGLLHVWAFYLAIPAGIVVGLLADGGKAHVAAAIFAGTVVTMFGASALY